MKEQTQKKETNGDVCDVLLSDSYPVKYKKEPEETIYVLDRNTEYTKIIEKNGKSNIFGQAILQEEDVTKVTGLNDSVVAEVVNNKEVLASYHDYGYSSNVAGHYYNGEHVEESGLIYLRARYYDASVGQFIQIDKNYKGEVNDSATHNRYNYTLSNPYKYVGRDGNIFKTIVKMTDIALKKTKKKVDTVKKNG